MHPWLLHSPPVSTYGAVIVAGFAAAWLWARTRARADGVEPSRVDLLMPLLLGMGLIGAWAFGRLAAALTHEASESAVLIGSLLVCTLAGIVYAILNRIPLGKLGDICAAPLAMGIGAGRIGCFFAGCCFGKASGGTTPLTAVHFPAGSLPFRDQIERGLLPAGSVASLGVYPVQLYESMFCIVLAAVLARRAGRGVMGERFLEMGLGYAAIRFVAEFLRADNPPIGLLTFSQWGAILMAFFAAATWVIRRRYATSLHLWRDRRDSVSLSV
jgi:phosphatidylglycerol:prolipoprotein diacylglycerol transferase